VCRRLQCMARSRCRCGRGGPSPGADVGGVGPPGLLGKACQTDRAAACAAAVLRTAMQVPLHAHTHPRAHTRTPPRAHTHARTRAHARTHTPARTHARTHAHAHTTRTRALAHSFAEQAVGLGQISRRAAADWSGLVRLVSGRGRPTAARGAHPPSHRRCALCDALGHTLARTAGLRRRGASRQLEMADGVQGDGVCGWLANGRRPTVPKRRTASIAKRAHGMPNGHTECEPAVGDVAGPPFSPTGARCGTLVCLRIPPRPKVLGDGAHLRPGVGRLTRADCGTADDEPTGQCKEHTAASSQLQRGTSAACLHQSPGMPSVWQVSLPKDFGHAGCVNDVRPRRAHERD
jgi:hypothetical protein